MDLLIEKYKGIHPGIILERELKKRSLKKGPFAIQLHEYPQTLNEITKGRRRLTPALALKIDQQLQLTEGTMLVLQAYHDIKKEKGKINTEHQPDLSIIRKIIFWDTDFTKIDWQRQYKAVIQRVFERGNEAEKAEIIRYYGKEKIEIITGKTKITNDLPPVLPNLNLR
ncbi:helix-turn-helix transcriptional regulator [Mucilaginibacter sp. FT3.2]|uniref:helix-turn-helix transcriptional regulator n=1 Tax=Mucilaginibacter sp. FT3.2 TaxID=2723090 RepID=UPI00160F5DD5|nr:plasmid maintenance system antidote protein [Mucilaginibacter sp. FT3.2]MBB6230912.1 plasmid maintenance system antidote protein VapI [Mucilaginibacter sp. FT3.2]